MKQKEFIKAIAKETGFTQKDVGAVMDAFETVLIDALKNGEEVKLMQGVTIESVYKEAGTCRNPQNGEQIEVPARYTCKAKFTKCFRDKINA